MKLFSILEFTIVPYHKTGRENNLEASIKAWSQIRRLFNFPKPLQDKLIKKKLILWHMEYPEEHQIPYYKTGKRRMLMKMILKYRAC